MIAVSLALVACSNPDDLGELAESELAIDGCTQLTAPVYHVVNPSNGESLYTLYASEASSAAKYGFTEDRGVAFKASSRARSGTVPAHRLYRSNPSDFFWTSSSTERSLATSKQGYVDQGVGFHVATATGNCLVPVYRYVHSGQGKHRFAVRAEERQALAAAGWTSEGVVFHAAGSSATAPQPPPTPPPTVSNYTINHDATRGRIHVENDILKLEFGYKTEPTTHDNQSGGNLYRYYDKRFSATQNISAVWEGGWSNTMAFASGIGGMGATMIYAVPDINWTGGASYLYGLADNNRDAKLRSQPVITTLADGSVKLVFDFAVSNYDWSPTYEWYTVLKTWTISPTGRIGLRHDWRISKTGYFSEPQTRNQVSTAFKTISRWGHTWTNSLAGPPGTNSRLNPANKWYHWVPNPTSIQECNAPDGSGGSQDAVHADFNRFHGGANFDFWFWPDNNGLGFEGLGSYRLGYTAFGGTQNGMVNEICHHNRDLVGDGTDAYNHSHMAWWGGDGATRDRYKPLTAGTTWTDTYQMEARPRGEQFPVSFGSTPPPGPGPGPVDAGTPPPEEGSDPDPTDTKFTLVVIPDTQREMWTDSDPRFKNRMDWLAKNKSSLDIRFVAHTGDLVDWDTADHIQYVRADRGYKVLDAAGMPYAIAIGNHDTAAVCPGGSACPGADTSKMLRVTTTFNQFFPTTRFPNFRGSWEPGKIDNAFHTFKAGGLDWLVINLELWPRTEAVNWAKSVLTQHPKHNAIIITHSHLTAGSGIVQNNGGYGANSPQYVYDNLYSKHANVRLVFSGHTGTHGYSKAVGVNGNTFHQFLNCYHDEVTNPTRLVEIDTAAKTLSTRVYAPYNNTEKNDGSKMSLSSVEWVR